MNWTVGRLSGYDALHNMLFSIAALSREVRISYMLEVILSFPVPIPNSL